jgi:hypothetical protein
VSHVSNFESDSLMKKQFNLIKIQIVIFIEVFIQNLNLNFYIFNLTEKIDLSLNKILNLNLFIYFYYL